MCIFLGLLLKLSFCPPFNSLTLDQYLGNNSYSTFYWCKEYLRLWNKQKRLLHVSSGKLGVIYSTPFQVI